MSTVDISLNSKTFALSSVNGREVNRTCSVATIPAGVDAADLLVGHQPGLGTKADRHVVKFTRTILDGANKPLQIGLHLVLTVPKGMTRTAVASQIAGEGSISDDMATLLTTDTYDFIRRIANNEFS